MSSNISPRLFAFYLPQYHPIPENDNWWGKGFTEWTNVVKAKPLFKGHYQPHLPADLGFYDLRVPEVRVAQAELARSAGIEGFCYWHYWFAGKRLLERPFTEVLQSGRPDFPFCLAWVNRDWTGAWNGEPERILIKQTYPGEKDHIDHFNTLLPAFSDSRYIKVDGKPLFIIYLPRDLPNATTTIALWRDLATRAGLKGLYMLGMLFNQYDSKYVRDLGFDALIFNNLNWPGKGDNNIIWKVILKILGKKRTIRWFQSVFNRPYHIYDFQHVARDMIISSDLGVLSYPCVFSNWDTTPRFGTDGVVGLNSTPEVFKEQLARAIELIQDYPVEQRLIFVKSWNEWAEGNHLEPDQKYGMEYLKVICECLSKFSSN